MSEALFEEKKESSIIKSEWDSINRKCHAMTKLRDNGIWDYSGNSTPSSNSISAF